MVGHVGLRPGPRPRLPGPAQHQQARHHHTPYGTTAHRHHLLARTLTTPPAHRSDHHTNEGEPTPIRLRRLPAMLIARSAALFLLAALLEIGGAWLVWQGVREHKGWAWIGAGVIALGLYGFVATLQPQGDFARVLAAYGGVFVAGSLVWGIVADGYRPDRWDVTGALVCLAGMAVIMYAPRR